MAKGVGTGDRFLQSERSGWYAICTDIYEIKSAPTLDEFKRLKEVCSKDPTATRVKLHEAGTTVGCCYGAQHLKKLEDGADYSVGDIAIVDKNYIAQCIKAGNIGVVDMDAFRAGNKENKVITATQDETQWKAYFTSGRYSIEETIPKTCNINWLYLIETNSQEKMYEIYYISPAHLPEYNTWGGILKWATDGQAGEFDSEVNRTGETTGRHYSIAENMLAEYIETIGLTYEEYCNDKEWTSEDEARKEELQAKFNELEEWDPASTPIIYDELIRGVYKYGGITYRYNGREGINLYHNNKAVMSVKYNGAVLKDITLPKASIAFIPITDDEIKNGGDEGWAPYPSLKMRTYPFSALDFKNVTYMGHLFSVYPYKRYSSIDVTGLRTNNVTSMCGMFDHCSKLKTLDASNFQTENVTNMNEMFYFCEELTSVKIPLQMTTLEMDDMFSYCSKLEKLTLMCRDKVTITTMSGAFNYCESLTELDLSNLDTSNCTNMKGAFELCKNLVSIKGVLDLKSAAGVNNWGVKNYSDMFRYCTKLTGVKIKNPPEDFTTHDAKTGLNPAGLRKDQYVIVQ